MQKPLALLALLSIVCTPMTLNARSSKHIYEDVDPYSGQKTLTLDVDTHGCPNDPGPHDAQVHLLISATEFAPKDVAYGLTVDLSHGSMLHPGKKGTMDTLMDGLPSQLPVAGRKSYWKEHSAFSRHRHLRETIPYVVSLEYLDALAEAKNFQFRINGEDHTLQRCTTASQLRDLHEFLNAAAAY